MTPPHQKASAFLAVEVNTEGDVQLEDHEEDDLSPQTPLSLPAVESGDSSQKSNTSAAHTEAEEITPESDLSRIPRRIWIVTTAALPWRTGTAVNPLLRALTLVHEGHTVSLLIPWLEAVEARKALYGNKDKNEWFESSTEQEAWIRRYCVERCNASQTTADQLQIQFWPGVYHESFGSIFPTEDICSLIPRDEADVCILEEPEHLNWFRVPNRQQKQPQSPTSRRNSAEDNDNKHGESSSPKKNSGSSSPSENINTSTEGNNIESDDTATAAADVELLGWAFKFRHVVGILHTNYADYVRQYGLMGTSILTATALNSLSSMVVKAYCHRVIRLSATLPHLDKTKEVTCNVHGVRHEFLERPAVVVDEEQATTKDGARAGGSEHGSTSTSQSEETPKSYAAVYFIGKLIWAKGFENVLHVEEKYKAETGEYFAMDIYGGGNDEKEIRKAFFGRHHGKFTSRSSSTVSDSSASSGVTKEKDQKAAAVFDTKVSLRDQLCGFGKDTVDDDNDFTVNTSTATTATEQQQQTAADSEESTSGRTTPVNATPTTAEILATPTVASPPMSPASAATEEPPSSTAETTGGETLVTPLEIFGDLSGKTLSTSVDTADAALKLIEKGPLAFHIAPAKMRFKVCCKCGAASVLRMPTAHGGFCLCCIGHFLTCSLLSFSCSGEETQYRLDFWEFRTTLWCEIFRITRYVLLWL